MYSTSDQPTEQFIMEEVQEEVYSVKLKDTRSQKQLLDLTCYKKKQM